MSLGQIVLDCDQVLHNNHQMINHQLNGCISLKIMVTRLMTSVRRNIFDNINDNRSQRSHVNRVLILLVCLFAKREVMEAVFLASACDNQKRSVI